MEESKTVMEQFNKYASEGVQCSIDHGDNAVPAGSVDFFNRHGYMVIKNICDFKNLSLEESQLKIQNLLEDIFNKKLYNTFYSEDIQYSSQHLSKEKGKKFCEISVCAQIDSNLNSPWKFCLQTLSGRERYVKLKNNWGVVYMGCEIDTWTQPLPSNYNKLKNFVRKILFKPDDTYVKRGLFCFKSNP